MGLNDSERVLIPYVRAYTYLELTLFLCTSHSGLYILKCTNPDLYIPRLKLPLNKLVYHCNLLIKPPKNDYLQFSTSQVGLVGVKMH